MIVITFAMSAISPFRRFVGDASRRLPEKPARLDWRAVFDTLSDRLQGALGDLREQGSLDEEAISRAMREVRLALLEADVNFEVVKDFVARVRERALGADVAKSLTPGQQVVKIVHEELTALMGTRRLAARLRRPAADGDPARRPAGLRARRRPPRSSRCCCARRAASPASSPPTSQRPAAIDQLEQLGREIQIPVFSEERADPVEAVDERARARARRGPRRRSSSTPRAGCTSTRR